MKKVSFNIANDAKIMYFSKKNSFSFEPGMKCHGGTGPWRSDKNTYYTNILISILFRNFLSHFGRIFLRALVYVFLSKYYVLVNTMMK